ncbi:28654_t:CDS:1 [Dentiscutata erythropus]|uniref:28654_t:CDS:1 n=1 Tax=Dentiscutata erythropus TaxID=1348616 RepID=A0A9N9G2Q5_9GLOM|nr:28654_t:CDS:1 [Dentiscutata erythropus]
MSTLDRLANELLFKIFTYLHRPAAFSLTCRTLHCVTKDPHARAAYFLRKYGPRLAIFYAIRNHAKIVTKETAEAMISSGAIVSRNLAQRLIKDYLERQPSEYFRCCWTSKLTFGTYLVFLQRAYTLYGDNLWAKDAMDDWEQFRICVSLQSGLDIDNVDNNMLNTTATHDTNREYIRDLVEKYHVVPLPLQYCFANISDTFVTIARIGDNQLLDMALNDLTHFDQYEFSNILPTIIEKLIYNKPTPTHLKKALMNIFSFNYPVLEQLALELIRNCGLYKIPNVIIETLIEKKDDLPFDLNAVVVHSINDKFHSICSYNGAPDNIESLWHYFPEFRPKVRENLNTLFADSRMGGVICSKNDASYYGYGVGCVCVEFILTTFGADDIITEKCFNAIIRDVCEKNLKMQANRNTLFSKLKRNDGAGLTLLQGSPQYFIQYVEAGVRVKPEHLKMVSKKGMNRKWFLKGLFEAMERSLKSDHVKTQIDSVKDMSSGGGNENVVIDKTKLWKNVIKEVLNQEREKYYGSSKRWLRKGRLYRMLDEFYSKNFEHS